METTPERLRILKSLEPDRAYSPREIADLAGITPEYGRVITRRMYKQGLLIRPNYGQYQINNNPTDGDHISNAGDTAIQGVYILRCNNLYKISKSNNVARRVTQLIAAMPHETIHVHTIPSDQPIVTEQEFHARYADKRYKGDWFELDMFDVDELCDL
jgi:predicted transcriptional regulator of viral defense system